MPHILESTTAGNLSQTPGLNLSSFNPLPLNISLQAELVIYSPLYAGQATISSLPSTQMNTSLPLPASSLALSNNVWMALTSVSNYIRQAVPSFFLTSADGLGKIQHVPFFSSSNDFGMSNRILEVRR